MKKAISILIIIAVIFTLAACKKNVPGVTGAGLTLEEELEAVNGMLSALRDFSESGEAKQEDTKAIEQQINAFQEISAQLEELTIFGADPLNNKAAGLMHEYDFSKPGAYDTRYTELPYYIFLNKQDGENEFTGNRYCTPGMVEGLYTYEVMEEYGETEEYADIGEHLEMGIIFYGYDFENEELIWENNKYEHLLVFIDEEQHTWGDIEPGELILLYFTYIGYSDIFSMHYGYYEYSEPIKH